MRAEHLVGISKLAESRAGSSFREILSPTMNHLARASPNGLLRPISEYGALGKVLIVCFSVGGIMQRSLLQVLLTRGQWGSVNVGPRVIGSVLVCSSRGLFIDYSVVLKLCLES